MTMEMSSEATQAQRPAFAMPPLALVMWAVAFVCSLSAGWAMLTWLTPTTPSPRRAILSVSSLPLLHARENALAHARARAAQGDAEVRLLEEETQSLEQQMRELLAQISADEKQLAGLASKAGAAEARKSALMAEEKRRAEILAAYAKAEAVRGKATETEKAGMSTPLAGGFTEQSPAEWAKEWGALTGNARAEIRRARELMERISSEMKQWEPQKDSIPPDKAKELQSLYSETEKQLQIARDQVGGARAELDRKIKEQGALLQKVLENATARE